MDAPPLESAVISSSADRKEESEVQVIADEVINSGLH